ncbi:MAG TPA: hypothetical protein DCE23_05910 [Firmicutes bacterium]|nr:hypothetical protein [Bacillota bacterium]
MKLKNLSIIEFDAYAKNHPLGSYHQTSSYALFASEAGYDYEILGLIDNEGTIHAATLLLYKKLGMFYRYGYAPKGFLIDYYNKPLLEEFIKALKKRYYNKNFAFIKINPEISIGTLDYTNKVISYNSNKNIEKTLINLGCRKLEGNRRFETKIPRFNAIQLLKKTNFSSLNKNVRNKINKGIKNGMSLEKGTREDIEILYKFIKNKKKYPISHYMNYYNAFSKKDAIDILLVKINFEECLINIREQYEKETIRNQIITEKTMKNPNNINLKRKIQSDNLLNTLNQNIAIASKNLAENKIKYIAGAITIKYLNRVYILISGYDKDFKQLCPNYFLHYSIIKYYQESYDFLDLNGITGDFSKSNPYKGLDYFKEGFNPLAFEYIGEYDVIINEGLYKNLDQTGQLAKEFKRIEKNINPND